MKYSMQLENNKIWLMLTLITVVTMICITVTYIIQYPIKMYYHGLENKTIMPPYLLEQFIKHGNVKIHGFCNLDDLDVPFTVALNTSSEDYGDLSKFEFNGLTIGNLRCEYEIEAGKK